MKITKISMVLIICIFIICIISTLIINEYGLTNLYVIFQRLMNLWKIT